MLTNESSAKIRRSMRWEFICSSKMGQSLAHIYTHAHAEAPTHTHTQSHRVTRRQTQAQGTLSLPRTQNVCTMLLACDAMYRSVVNKEFFRYNELRCKIFARFFKYIYWYLSHRYRSTTCCRRVGEWLKCEEEIAIGPLAVYFTVCRFAELRLKATDDATRRRRRRCWRRYSRKVEQALFVAVVIVSPASSRYYCVCVCMNEKHTVVVVVVVFYSAATLRRSRISVVFVVRM